MRKGFNQQNVQNSQPIGVALGRDGKGLHR
jgi:hypothetical protein